MPLEDHLGEEPEDRLPDAQGDVELIEAVTTRFEEIFGPVVQIYHEKESSIVHVDMHLLPPAPDDGFHTIFTTGMAERPMNVPGDVPEPENYRYAELVLHLPADWPLEWSELSKPENWWPLESLRAIARIPHERETWIWGGHTLRHGEPYAANTELCAAFVCPSYLLPEDSETIRLGKDREVVFLTLAFIYREELQYCMDHGSEAFLDLVQESGMSPLDFFVLDLQRPNLCA